MNICIFLGNITHDLEVRSLQSGAKVLNFSLAINRSYKNAKGENVKEADFFNFEAWDTGAETMARHLKKGDPVIVYCSARTDKYQDAEGKTLSKTKFRVDRFEFVPTRAKKEEAPVRGNYNNDDDDSGDGSTNEPIPF